MKKLVAVLTGALSVLLTSGVAQAVDAKFPNKDDSGDLASDAAWGEVAHPPTSRLVIDQTEKIYTASEDITFAGLQFQRSPNMTNTFQLTSGRKVTLNGGLNSYYANSFVTYAGGEWVVTGTMQPSLGSNNRAGNVFELVQGVNFSSVGSVALGATAIRARLTLKEKSQLHAGNAPAFVGNTTRDSVLEVLDGSLLTWKSGTSNFAGTGASNNIVRVSGAGSIMSNDMASAISFQFGNTDAFGNVIRVEKGGVLDVWGSASARAGFKVGYGANAFSNRIEVVGQGSILRMNGLSVNDHLDSWGNSIFIGDGAEFDLTSGSYGDADLLVKGRGKSAIIISNATLKCRQFTIGQNTESTHSVFRAVGAGTVLSTPCSEGQGAHLFGGGSNNEIVLDGCSWGGGLGGIEFGSSSNEGSNNAFRLQNGASVTTKRIYVGADAGACDWNTTYVLSGSTLTLTNAVSGNSTTVGVEVPAAENRLVLSNGTVQVTGNGGMIRVGYSFKQGQEAACSNDMLLVQGSTSRVRAERGWLQFHNRARFRLELPQDGFEVTPVVVSGFSMSADSSIEIDCAAFQAALRSRATVTLAEATDTMSVPDAVIDAANAALDQQKGKLIVLDNKLLLKVKADSGLVLLVR